MTGEPVALDRSHAQRAQCGGGFTLCQRNRDAHIFQMIGEFRGIPSPSEIRPPAFKFEAGFQPRLMVVLVWPRRHLPVSGVPRRGGFRAGMRTTIVGMMDGFAGTVRGNSSWSHCYSAESETETADATATLKMSVMSGAERN